MCDMQSPPPPLPQALFRDGTIAKYDMLTDGSPRGCKEVTKKPPSSAGGGGGASTAVSAQGGGDAALSHAHARDSNVEGVSRTHAIDSAGTNSMAGKAGGKKPIKAFKAPAKPPAEPGSAEGGSGAAGGGTAVANKATRQMGVDKARGDARKAGARLAQGSREGGSGNGREDKSGAWRASACVGQGGVSRCGPVAGGGGENAGQERNGTRGGDRQGGEERLGGAGGGVGQGGDRSGRGESVVQSLVAAVTGAVREAVQLLAATETASFVEMASCPKPHAAIGAVLEAVCLVLKERPEWVRVTEMLSGPHEVESFLERVSHVTNCVIKDVRSLEPTTIKLLSKFVDDPELSPQHVRSLSQVARCVCVCVRACLEDVSMPLMDACACVAGRISAVLLVSCNLYLLDLHPRNQQRPPSTGVLQPL
jgi:hypothetical protein